MSEQYLSDILTTTEATKPAPDFSNALYFAQMNALPIDTAQAVEGIFRLDEQEKSSPSGAEVYRDQADDFIIDFDAEAVHEPHIVGTTDPDEYRVLFRQSLHLPVDAEGDEELEKLAKEHYDHEMAHAAKAKQVNPAVQVWYLIGSYKGLLSNGEYQNYAVPGIVPLGRMKKIEFAMIVAAPNPPSDSDMRTLKAMGYNSTEEVRAKYYKMILNNRV